MVTCKLKVILKWKGRKSQGPLYMYQKSSASDSKFPVHVFIDEQPQLIGEYGKIAKYIRSFYTEEKSISLWLQYWNLHILAVFICALQTTVYSSFSSHVQFVPLRIFLYIYIMYQVPWWHHDFGSSADITI